MVIETLLSEILTPDRLSEVAERAVEGARAERQAAPHRRKELQRQLADIQSALDRLTTAVACGGDVPSLVEAIKAQENKKTALEHRLTSVRNPAITMAAGLKQKLHDGVENWREVLGRQVPQARQIVQKLLTEKITFTPEACDGQQGFRFQATAPSRSSFQELFQGFHKRWYPKGSRLGTSCAPGSVSWIA